MHNHFLNISQRIMAVTGAVLIATTLFAGAAANAQQARGGYYRATLAAAATADRAIAGSVVWRCNDTSCTAPRGDSRPAIMCARLVREVGTVTAFAAGDRALTAEELARCNLAA